MSHQCAAAPASKKEFITDIGEKLVSAHGKQDFYTPAEVQEAHRNSKWYHETDYLCWAMSVFCDQSSFNLYHELRGEDCDYTAMKTEMLKGISADHLSNPTEISDVDADASWLETFSIADGLGEFFGSIFDGI